MRPVTFTDLLTPFHYFAATFLVLVLLLEGYGIYKTVKQKHTAMTAFFTLLLLATFALSYALGVVLMPGGKMNDTIYQTHQAEMAQIQNQLEHFHSICKEYPLTSQGLRGIERVKSPEDCERHKAKRAGGGDFFYESDGTQYSLESTAEYRIKNLVVRGTNSEKAGLFIRQ